MRKSACGACVVLGLIAPLVAVSAARGEDGAVEAKVAFDRMKSLEGDWIAKGGGEHPDAKVIYKVTAAGSALMQIQHAGTGHEMVTMYHLDGDELLATHYCAAGNQPRLKLDRKGSRPDRLSFVFDGGTNLDPAKDMYISSFRISFLDGGKLEEEWDGTTGGKKAGSTKFPMTRP